MKTYEELTSAIMNGAKNGGGGINNDDGGRAVPLCRFFFQNNHCRNGIACRFSHDIPDGLTHAEALKTIPCPYFATGECRYMEYCRLLHETRIKPDVCAICLESPPEKKRQYGILSCCNHAFCFTCLMEWRTEGSSEVTSRRVCPTCRKSSDYVVPSSYMPANETEKETVLNNYKAHCALIPCKHFELGKLGSCPFGKNCFYAHTNRKGKDIKSKDKSMQQLYEERRRGGRNNDDDIDYITDMLLMIGLQRHLARQERGNRRGDVEESSDDEYDDHEDDPDFFITDIITAMLEDDDVLTGLLGPRP